MLKWQKFNKETKKPVSIEAYSAPVCILPPGVYDKAAARACDRNTVNLYERFIIDYEAVDADAMKKELVKDF